MSVGYLWAGIFVTAIVTYFIRMIPIVIFKKKITNRRIRSFLYYVPYAVLSAMTFPAIFESTGSTISGVVGCMVALLLAYFNKGLLVVAVGASAAVFLVNIAL